MKKRIFLLIVLLLLAWGYQESEAFVAPRTAHPRLISDAEIARLQAAKVANTTEWQFINTWCSGTHNPTIEGPTASRVGTTCWSAVVYALGYATDPTHTDWADEAYRLLALWLNRDISGTGYDSITVVTNFDVGYNMRFELTATALVYDLCFNFNSVSRPVRNARLAGILDAWLHYWYINNRNANPTGTMCYRPYSNHYIGQMYALLYGGYAIYSEKPTYSTRYLSYGRDTMLVQFANEAKDGTKIWTQLLSTQGQSSGGLLPDGFPGYVANSLEFLGRVIETVSTVESKTAAQVLGSNFVTGTMMTYMYATYPSTRFNGAWRLWGDEEGLIYATVSRSAWYSMLSLFGAAPAANDTTKVAKWWLENYKPYVDPTASDWGRYFEYFLCTDHTVAALDPTNVTGHTVIGDTWSAKGATTTFYRNAWSGVSSDNIHLVLRGGNASDGHVQNDFGSLQITAGDLLVGNYKLLANTSDQTGESRVSASSDWSNSGIWVKQDDNYTAWLGGNNAKIRWSSSHGRHYNNQNDWFYSAANLTPFYNNEAMNRTYGDGAGQDVLSHVTHKDVEWLYLKSDSVLVQVDRAYTRTANYGGGPTGAGYDTLWAQVESTKQWQIWTQDQPVLTSGVWRIAGHYNRADLMLKTNYPASGVNETACLRKKFKTAATPPAEWRVVDSLTTPNAAFVTMHTMKIVGDAGVFNTYTSTNARGSCAVSAFKSNRRDTLDYLIAFGVNDTLNVTTASMFNGDSIIIGHSAAPRTNTHVMICDLTPSTTYYWRAVGGTSLAVTVSKHNPGTAITATSDTSGVLIFDTATGTVLPPGTAGCTIDTPSIFFGTYPLASCSTPLTFNIHNTGSTTLTGTVSETSPDFEITSGGGAYSLVADASKNVSVRFCPTSMGVKMGTIETGDAACSDVQVIGVGETPTITLTSPTAGQIWVKGTARTISWVCSGTTNPVAIKLYKGSSGTVLQAVIISSTGNTGYYTWGVNDFGGGQGTYRIVVEDTVLGVNGVSGYVNIIFPTASNSCKCGKG